MNEHTSISTSSEIFTAKAELELAGKDWMLDRLNKKIDCLKAIYNGTINHILSIFCDLEKTNEWKQLIKNNSNAVAKKKLAGSYGLTDYALQKWYTHNMAPYFKKARLGADIERNAVSRAYHAFEAVYLTGNPVTTSGRKVILRQKKDCDNMSIINPKNECGLRYRNGKLIYFDMELQIKTPKNKARQEFYINSLNNSKIKSITILKKVIRDRQRFFVHFTLEGSKPQSDRLHPPDNIEMSGLYIGDTFWIAVKQGRIFYEKYNFDKNISVSNITEYKQSLHRRNANTLINKIGCKVNLLHPDFTYLKEHGRGRIIELNSPAFFMETINKKLYSLGYPLKEYSSFDIASAVSQLSDIGLLDFNKDYLIDNVPIRKEFIYTFILSIIGDTIPDPKLFNEYRDNFLHDYMLLNTSDFR